jgi:putative ABC transport system ATP-binding protein
MAGVVVETRAVCRTYGTGASAFDALRGVDIVVEAGELVAVMGPSGSGKSTLLNLLGALDTPTSGEVLVEGHALSTLDDAGRTELRRHRIGFVFQQFNLVSHLTAEENVALPLLTARRPRPERAAGARAALASVGVGELGARLPNELSGGEQQRVAIARALVNEPAILLADEPTGNLDTETGKIVMGELASSRAHGGHAVVVVTHDGQLAAQCDRIIRLRDGRVDA